MSEVCGCARVYGKSGDITVIIISVQLIIHHNIVLASILKGVLQNLCFFPGDGTRFGRYFNFRRRDRRIFDVMFTSLVESDLSAIHFHVYQIKSDVTIS